MYIIWYNYQTLYFEVLMGRKQKYNINKEYFKNIDSEEKAYILGLLYADGTMVRSRCGHQISLTLQEADRDILDKISDLIAPDKPLLYIAPRSDRYSSNGQYRFNISSKDMCDDLEFIGFNNKSSMPMINEDLIPHFIRGYFDGDGCISISSRGDCEFFIMAEEGMLNSFKELIPLEFPDPKHVKSNMFKIRKSGKNNLNIIFEYLYTDASIFLNRKFEKFGRL